MASFLEHDISVVPDEVPCVNPDRKAEFEQEWPAVKELLLKHTVPSLIASFFPDLVVPEETKWSIHHELDALLKDSPRDIALLRKRAIVRLQCNIPVHAFSDGLMITGTYNEEKMKERTAYDFILDAQLICLFAALLMRDRDHISSTAIPALALYFRSNRHYFNQLNPSLVSMMQNNLFQAIETGLTQGDHFLEALMLLVSLLQLAEPMMPAGMTQTVPRLIALQLQILFLLQNDLKYRLSMLQKQDLFGKGPVDPHILHRMTFSSILLPALNRKSPGGDRDPNTVLRVLFSSKREVMQFVRVTVDTEKGGFKLVAKSDIAANEVYMVEKALASFVNPIPSDPHCQHCLKAIALSDVCSCAECGEVYCSAACRDEAYALYHRAMCKDSGWSEYLKSCAFHTVMSSFPFATCLSFKLMIMAELQGKTSPFDIPEFKILTNALDVPANQEVSADPSSPPLLIPNIMVCGKLISCYQMFRNHCPRLLKESSLVDLVYTYRTVAPNSIGHWNSTKTMHETQLFTVASFANHSCEPNTDYFLTSDTSEFMFRALKPIKAGEEIAISYVAKGLTYSERQRALMTNYGFQCHCQLCLREVDASTGKTGKRKGKATKH